MEQVLKDENGRLNKLLGERDEEMRILCKARDGEKRALAGEKFKTRRAYTAFSIIIFNGLQIFLEISYFMYIPTRSKLRQHSAALAFHERCKDHCLKVAQTLFSLGCSSSEK